MTTKAGRIKRATLLSGFGALVLGLGLGLLLPAAARSLALPVLVAGILAHGWGMFEAHGLERGSEEVPARWAEALYWACWLVLGGLGVWMAIQLAGAP